MDTGRSIDRTWCLAAALCVALVCTLTLAPDAGAQPIVGDDFNYTGALTANGWAAHSGAGAKIIMANSSVATLDQSAGSGEDVNLGFPPLGAADKVYASFDLMLPSGQIVDPGVNGLYFAHFKDATFGFRGRMGVVDPQAAGDYAVAINADSGALGAGATWATDLSFDTTYKIIISYDASTGAAELWVDATVETDPKIVDAVGSAGTLITAFALRQSNAYTGSQIIDNVVVATTFGDALATPPGPLTGACCDEATFACIDNVFQGDCTFTWIANGTCAADCVGVPDTGACCVGIACSVTTQNECETIQFGTWRGANVPCSPEDPCDCRTIERAKELGAGHGFRLCDGVISSSDDQVGGGCCYSFQIQDLSGLLGTPRGITLFDNNTEMLIFLGQIQSHANNPSGLLDGVRIVVVGRTANFNGLLELEDPILVDVIDVPGVPQATVITVADLLPQSPTAEGLESTLVTLDCVTFVGTCCLPDNSCQVTSKPICDSLGGTIDFTDNDCVGVPPPQCPQAERITFVGGTSDSFYVTDSIGNPSVIIRVNRPDMDLHGTPVPTGPVTLTGVFGQYDTSAPYDESYQLQLRSLADLVLCGVCATCPGDLDPISPDHVDFDDIDDFVLALLDPFPNICADIGGGPMGAPDGIVNGLDIGPMIDLVLANAGAGSPCPTPPTPEFATIEVCGAGECIDTSNTCVYTLAAGNIQAQILDPLMLARCIDNAGAGPFAGFGGLNDVCVVCNANGPSGGDCNGQAAAFDTTILKLVQPGGDCWVVAAPAQGFEMCFDCDTLAGPNAVKLKFVP